MAPLRCHVMIRAFEVLAARAKGRGNRTNPALTGLSERTARRTPVSTIEARSIVASTPTWPMPLKKTQGFFNEPDHPRVVPQYGCLVMEVEDWIDIINQPEWQRNKRVVFGPGDGDYSLNAVYKFSVQQ